MIEAKRVRISIWWKINQINYAGAKYDIFLDGDWNKIEFYNCDRDHEQFNRYQDKSSN